MLFSLKAPYALMDGMDQKQYLSLIDDALAYIKELQPQKIERQEIKIELLAPLPPKPQTKAPPPKIEPTAPPPKKKNKEKTDSFFELQPPPSPPQESTLAIQKILKEIDSDLYLHASIPSDHKAKRIKEAWREKRETPEIPILFQGQQYRTFITRIAKAIDTIYGSCRIVEIEPQKKWDIFLESENLKLIIAPDTSIFGTKEILPFYQENPQQKSRKLGKIPLLLLPDLSIYFKDPYLKRSLWNVIKTTIEN